MALKYRHLRLTAYNKDPNEPDCFHADVLLDPKSKWTPGLIMERLLKPALHCVYSKMIPEMPHVASPKGLARLEKWERKYFWYGEH